MIVLVASPKVRTLCPASMIEGEWREIPDEARKITFEPARLLALPNGKMRRRQSDGVTAPEWEIRYDEDWK